MSELLRLELVSRLAALSVELVSKLAAAYGTV
jgi:hypothetical protein